jgi:hypothetical protein
VLEPGHVRDGHSDSEHLTDRVAVDQVVAQAVGARHLAHDALAFRQHGPEDRLDRVGLIRAELADSATDDLVDREPDHPRERLVDADEVEVAVEKGEAAGGVLEEGIERGAGLLRVHERILQEAPEHERDRRRARERSRSQDGEPRDLLGACGVRGGGREQDDERDLNDRAPPAEEERDVEDEADIEEHEDLAVGLRIDEARDHQRARGRCQRLEDRGLSLVETEDEDRERVGDRGRGQHDTVDGAHGGRSDEPQCRLDDEEDERRPRGDEPAACRMWERDRLEPEPLGERRVHVSIIGSRRLKLEGFETF